MANTHLALFVLLALPGLAAAQAPAELTPRAKGDLAIQARAILRKYCHECHGGAASRGTVSVLEHAKLVATGPNPIPFVVPGKAGDSQVIQFIEDGSMPPGGRTRPKPEEIATLKAWVTASAPAYPTAFDEQTTLKVMLDDIAARPAGDVPHLRYFSLSHLVTDDGDLRAINTADAELHQALTWCGAKPPPGKPAAEPVDAAATLFRFDTRTVGWDNRDLFVRSEKGAGGVHGLTPYDLILLEYPHGFGLASDHPHAKRLNDYFAKAGLALPVPYLRGDWVGKTLKKFAPLAADLRSLNELSEALAKQGKPAVGQERSMPCGPATQGFDGGNPIPITPKPEPVRPVLPLFALYTGDSHTDPPPFVLTAETVTVDKKHEVLKAAPPGMSFFLRVKAGQDVHFALFLVWSDGTIKLQPTKQGSFLKAGEHLITPKDAKEFKISNILLPGQQSATEYFVLVTSPTPLPPPVIVRSRHAVGPRCEANQQHPVYRFLFDWDKQPEGFDPTRFVRKVGGITTTEKKPN